MFNEPQAVIEAKSVLISKVYLADQTLVMELLNNLLDVAYHQGRIAGMNSARALVDEVAR